MEFSLNSLLSEPLFADSEPCATLRRHPLGFVDVGFRGGTHPLVEPVAGLTAVLGFEPDPDEYRRLIADDSVKKPWALFAVEPVALAAAEGTAQLHLMSAPTNHSLLPPNKKFTRRYNMVKWEQTGSISVPTASLDQILFGSRHDQPFWGEFLKLDTESTEFDVFNGAKRTLAERCVAIFSEVEFFQVRKGQKLFSEVELFLREYGFAFYGLANVGGRSCKLLDKRNEAGRERPIYADAIFLKDPLSRGAGVTPPTERANHVLFVCALLLGYYDFALELALATWATGPEATRIEALVKKCATMPLSKAYDDALELADRVKANPRRANIEVGHFVDRRRDLGDYNDVT
jgi:FkbM family methyltransferase